jgi:hypothetical protein
MLLTCSRAFFASNGGNVRLRPRRARPRASGRATIEFVEPNVARELLAGVAVCVRLRAVAVGSIACKIVATTCSHHSRSYGQVQSASTWPSTPTRIVVHYGSRSLPSTVPRTTAPVISSALTFPRRAYEAPRDATSLDVPALIAACPTRISTSTGVGFAAASIA